MTPETPRPAQLLYIESTHWAGVIWTNDTELITNPETLPERLPLHNPEGPITTEILAHAERRRNKAGQLCAGWVVHASAHGYPARRSSLKAVMNELHTYADDPKRPWNQTHASPRH